MRINKKKLLGGILDKKEKILTDGVQNMQKAPLDTQITFLGKAKGNILRDTLEQQTPGEMHKGAEKLRKEGKPVTVDNLLRDGKNPDRYYNNPKFMQLAKNAGLDESYFIGVAEKECENWK